MNNIMTIETNKQTIIHKTINKLIINKCINNKINNKIIITSKANNNNIYDIKINKIK